MARRLAGIRMPVMGRAIRLVSRKYFGKVPKYIHARGPVVVWHEIDSAAISHIFLNGLKYHPVSFSGHILFRCGYMNAIPAIAA